MAENSNISWTHHTFNPWRGCVKVSAGCKHCYAEQLVTKRQGLPLWGLTAERRVAAESTWKEPVRWNRKAQEAGVRHRVFCASLADVFEDRPDLVAPRARLFRLIEATPHLDWLLLTKRPQDMARLAQEAGWPGRWPTNVWAGTTVEDQEQAEERVWRLLGVPARVRFLSCEPLLGPLDLAGVRLLGWRSINGGEEPRGAFARWQETPMRAKLREGIDWVIVGGESGPSARIFDLAWARDLLSQCRGAGVPFFFKQAGNLALDSDWSGLSPLALRDPKGGDLQELPEDLRIQEFPPVTAPELVLTSQVPRG